MPFGISSASEVFQMKMHKLVAGLQGIEVVADDFVVETRPCQKRRLRNSAIGYMRASFQMREEVDMVWTCSKAR